MVTVDGRPPHVQGHPRSSPWTVTPHVQGHPARHPGRSPRTSRVTRANKNTVGGADGVKDVRWRGGRSIGAGAENAAHDGDSLGQ